MEDHNFGNRQHAYGIGLPAPLDNFVNVYINLDIMDASIVDLRYKTKEILAALERRETVSVLYRGKLKGIIEPPGSTESVSKVRDHEMFGCSKAQSEGVDEIMELLRGGRV